MIISTLVRVFIIINYLKYVKVLQILFGLTICYVSCVSSYLCHLWSTDLYTGLIIETRYFILYLFRSNMILWFNLFFNFEWFLDSTSSFSTMLNLRSENDLLRTAFLDKFDSKEKYVSKALKLLLKRAFKITVKIGKIRKI